jgi:hypothetical protein
MLVVAFFAIWHFLMDYHFNELMFDAAVWKSFNNNDDPDNPRGQMFDDLTKSYLKKGLPKKGIEALLGPADLKSENYFWSYNLGMWSGFRMDYDSLDLKFDHDGKLTKFYRVQH